ncbi:hypothetical protein ACEPPN_014172 [Leptodophora sp. 'Broadleaf-Isolate-01']
MVIVTDTAKFLLHQWKHSRALVPPPFSKEASNLNLVERHVQTFAPDFQSGRRQLNIYRGSPTTLLLLYFGHINRVLIRTRPAQLEKIDRSFDKADTELIKKLCNSLSITNKTKIVHLITRISDDKKLDDKKLDDKKVENKKMDDREVDNK